MLSRLVRLCVLVLALAIGAPSRASASCEELAYGSPTYHRKMDELASQAQLPGAAWNRYHESLVAALCAGKADEIDQLVDSGSLPAAEAKRIAEILRQTYSGKQHSQVNKSFAEVKAEFVEMGLCNACADNIAQYYARKPGSPCAKLAQRALNGDSRAIDELATSPAECIWTY